MINIFWFRRDLRLEDNAALYLAAKDKYDTLPIFIYDENILASLPKDDARVSFIHQLLSDVQNKLGKKGKSLATFLGNPLDVFQRLIAENNVRAVFANHDYEPYAIQRDEAVKEFLLKQNIDFITSKDQVVFEKNEVVKNDGTPYVVFTPYSRRWKELFAQKEIEEYASEKCVTQIAEHSYPFLSLSDIGFVESNIQVASFDLSEKLIDNYEATRNFPAIDGTSFIGPHLRFGAISIRRVAKIASLSQKETFLNELIWREFFMQILWHYPGTVTKSFKEQYDRIVWDNNEKHFAAWCEGKTGYPMVDAGMRQLNTTGNMHNRVRMVVASFLCKHLLIDWRWGEAYFAEKLLDYEQSSNVGNWQWSAGSGVDAAPYFRIFNPEEQIKKFDPKYEYIRKWIPELNSLEYPNPIVEHKAAREKCLRVYKTALE